jgi:hypothetical protein
VTSTYVFAMAPSCLLEIGTGLVTSCVAAVDADVSTLDDDGFHFQVHVLSVVDRKETFSTELHLM